MASREIDEHLSQWDGTAFYRGTVYRVLVICSSSAWKNDVEKAVRKAGGASNSLELRDSVSEPDAGLILHTNCSFLVRFKPDSLLTENARCRPSTEVCLRQNLSVIYDGEFMRKPICFGVSPSAPVHSLKNAVPRIRR